MLTGLLAVFVFTARSVQAACNYTTITGDADRNGTVDASDLFPIAAHYGAQPLATDEWCTADTDGSGTIDASDLFPIATHYGEVDTTPPVQSAWNPTKSATITTTSPTITFTTDENADCKWSLTDQAYSNMAGDCTGDGTTSQSCSASGLSEGAEIIYIACRNMALNADTIDTNEHVDYTVDSLPPTQSTWVPAKSSAIASTTQTITFTTNENADCKWSLTDDAYATMVNDCTGDGTTNQSCATSELVEGAEIVYIACRDTLLNADTIATNEHVDYTVDTILPEQNGWSPAKSLAIASTTQTITFTTNENADCKWSLTDDAYATMVNDCTGDGTTNHSCATSELVEGAEIVYIACRDTLLNADTIATNEHVDYTVDTILPEQSAWNPAKSATLTTSSSPTITFTTNENADCKWSLTDDAYATMIGDCTGDGTASQSCAVTGLIDGAEIVYIACRDTALNADTIATNEHVNYTVAVPPAFTGIKAITTCGSGCLDVSWNEAVDNSTPITYNIYYSTASGGQNFAVTNTTTQATSAQITGLIDGQRYYFVVRTEDSQGNEDANTTEVSGLPDAYSNPRITIPAGSFIMGCADGDTQCVYDEEPKHTVTLSEYDIQKYEVTNAQYKACVDAEVCTAPKYSSSITHPSYYGNAAYDNYPVIHVDWNQAKVYCQWIGGRLPTDAEWEKAARGPSPREVLYPWGNDAPTCSLANGYINGAECVGDTSEAGSYPTGYSYYGAMDMAGNVWEWVEDDYHNTYSGAPNDGSAWIDSPRGEFRVLRGGSWYYSEKLRVSHHNKFNYPDSSGLDIGFRCAQVIANHPPTATAQAAPATGDPPLNVQFTGSCTDADGTCAFYSWTFGDGGTSTEQNPTHAYSSFGNYIATLTVTDDDGATDQNAVSIAVTSCVNGWCTIPAGSFIMGCADGDTQCSISNFESPKHTVTLSEFKIQKYEVTNAQYKACVDAEVCTAPKYSSSITHPSYYGNMAYNNYPVIYVDWDQSKTYCQWIGGRLPTEAEWEKAARGPSPREVIYPWGNTLSGSYANYMNSGDPYDNDTTPMGYYLTGASYYGVMDMAGNVGEWVNDWYYGIYYSSSPSVDPQGPGSGSQRVLRGGGWVDHSENLRVSNRRSLDPTDSWGSLGFRCAQD